MGKIGKKILDTVVKYSGAEDLVDYASSKIAKKMAGKDAKYVSDNTSGAAALKSAGNLALTVGSMAGGGALPGVARGIMGKLAARKATEVAGRQAVKKAAAQATEKVMSKPTPFQMKMKEIASSPAKFLETGTLKTGTSRNAMRAAKRAAAKKAMAEAAPKRTPLTGWLREEAKAKPGFREASKRWTKEARAPKNRVPVQPAQPLPVRPVDATKPLLEGNKITLPKFTPKPVAATPVAVKIASKAKKVKEAAKKAKDVGTKVKNKVVERVKKSKAKKAEAQLKLPLE